MKKSKLRAILMPLGLFVLSAGAYWSVLMGVVPFGLDAPLIFGAIAGATALGAVKIGARAPALTAGVAALGFTLAGASVGGILRLGDSAVLVGAALATLGVLTYTVSMIHHIGTRVQSVSPA
ncbi:hypothetical protein SAMN05421858_4979 [Haladaptatus litoreus]|uniref:Uncharacterized protein n=1 Tax=Haladaptatus litoreus TaxID=553468 RepID=A0A1N7FE04_9EURY|nr:hypothetical protein [Haladaptatus litoreus]SIR98446.1 hypothetical protein SAMN05421858_4979 [Haladaptatus litoreus]